MAYVASASSAPASAATSLTITLAAANGVKILLAININGRTSATVTWPAGFTELGHAATTTSNNGTLGVIYAAEKAVASGEPGSYNVSIDGAATDIVGGGITFSGRSSSLSTVITQTNDAASSLSPVSIPLGGVTASLNDDILWIGGVSAGVYAGTWSTTPPTSYTSRIDRTDASGIALLNFSTREAVSAGATGTLTGSSANVANLADSMGIVIALPLAVAIVIKRNNLALMGLSR